MSVQNNISLVIPDSIIVDTVNKCLTILRNDYNDRLQEDNVDESILSLLLNGISIGKYNFLDNAIKIFITTPQDPRHLSAQLSYNHTSSKSPAIYITLPSENDKENSIGIGEGNQDPIVIAHNSPLEDEYRAQYNRRYNCTYYIVLLSENRDEMAVLYNILKALLVSCTVHFELCGISNLKIGGQDLRLNPEVPDRVFTRALTLNFTYEQVVPALVIQNVFRTIRLYWKPEGAITSQGPIVFNINDDLDDSDSTP